MREYIPQKQSFRYVLKVGVLFVVYFLVAKLSLGLYSVHTFAIFVWPATGIAIAALILYGYDLWIGVLLGAFLANFVTGAPFFVALGIGVGNALEAIVATYLLRHYIVLYRCFDRLRDTLGFILFGGLVATMVGATIGVSSLALGGIVPLSDFISTWFTWWIGDTLGALVVAPFLLTVLSPTRAWNADSLSATEIISFVFTLLASNYIVFWHPFSHVQNLPLFYLISLPLLWGGIRFGSRGLTFSIFITSLVAVLSFFYQHGPFNQIPVHEGVLFLQIFIGTVSITFLIFLSIVKERGKAAVDLQHHIDKLEKAVDKISSADQAKNDFLATLAHELRNPLAPLRSSLELLKIQTAENSKALNVTTGMEKHVETMTRLLDDLLDISRITRKKIVLEKEIVKVQTVVKHSIEMVEPLLHDRKHTLTVSMPEKPLWIHGDPIRLEQIVVNILNNAAKYTDMEGNIFLSCAFEENNIRISIKDTGRGIDSTMLSQIFEPFVQINNEYSRGNKGLGIGLSLTQKLVELHDGKIIAKSEGVGHGSEFIIYFPIPENTEWLEESIEPALETIKNIVGILDSENIQHKETVLVEAIPQVKKYKILVVDDNEAAASGLGELLRIKGHSVELAYDGTQAIEVAQKFSPEVVVLDIGLPQMDGYEVARKLCLTVAYPLILVALTGYGQADDKQKAFAAGFNYHLTKPISIADIEKILVGL